jgi:hypothetical protein
MSMNWMIDGLYGDLYRTAMGYRPLKPHDEWEIERHMAKGPSLFQRAKTAVRKFWATERGSSPVQHLGFGNGKGRVITDYALKRSWAAESKVTSISTLFHNWWTRL